MDISSISTHATSRVNSTDNTEVQNLNSVKMSNKISEDFITDWVDKVLNGEIDFNDDEDSASLRSERLEKNDDYSTNETEDNNQTAPGSSSDAFHDIKTGNLANSDNPTDAMSDHTLNSPSYQREENSTDTWADLISNNQTHSSPAVGTDVPSVCESEENNMAIEQRSDDEHDGWDVIDLNSEIDEDYSSPATATSPTNETINSENIASTAVLRENDTEHKTYLLAYFQILQFFFVSPKFENFRATKDKCQYIFWFVITILGYFHSSAAVKNYIIFHDNDDNILLVIVKIGFFINNLALQICFCHIVTCSATNLLQLMSTLQKNEPFRKKPKVTIFVGCISLSSIVLGLGFPIAYTIEYLEEFDLEDVILYHSFRLSRTVFGWNQRNQSYENIKIQEQYATNLTFFSTFLGVTDIVITIVGHVQQNFIKDISLVLAFTMYTMTSDFKNEFTKVSDIEALSVEAKQTIWVTFKLVCSISKKFNEIFEVFFQFLHLHNLLFCAYFLIDHILVGQCVWLSILQSVVLMKIICFYAITSSAASVVSML